MTQRDERLGQSEAPLARAILRQVEIKRGGAAAFHFPGHKGRALSREMQAIFADSLRCDLTEIPGLDDLHSPSGPISKAQTLAALAFGATHSFFLVGGASAGVLASLGALPRGQKIAICRNAHRSAVSALRVSGGTPVWVPPCREPDMFVSLPCGLDALGRTGAEIAFLVSPTYEGLLADMKSPCSVTLIVDEAHGSHFYFSREMPGGALCYDVSAVIHGTHKTLGSLTGSGLLHLKGGAIDYQRTKQMLSTIQTSSPSYLMMASLDLARKEMATRGEYYIGTALEEARQARERLNRSGINVFYPACVYDELKLVVPSSQFRMSGQTLEKRLRKHGVWIEYAGLLHVVAVFSVGDEPGCHEKLTDALERIATSEIPHSADAFAAATRAGQLLDLCALPKQVMPPREAWQSSSRSVPINESVGHIAAESLFIYPPGTALIVEGEEIPVELPEIIKELKRAGVRFHGTEDPYVGTIRVVTS